jgi:hypothetical protein
MFRDLLKRRGTPLGQIGVAWKRIRFASNLLFVVLLLAQFSTTAGAEEEPTIPAWIDEINPADYILLDTDLPAGLHVAGEIFAEARAAETAVMKDGRADVERFAFFEANENICQPDPEGVYDCIGGNYLLSVYVYETVDLARAVWENTIVEQYGELPPPEGFDYVSNVIDPLDPRFGGQGSCVGPYIWYRNIGCTIFGNWDENDRKIASLWLDKVSNAEPPVQVNLKMRAEGLSLIMGYVYHGYFIGTGNFKPLQEIAADKQAVQAQVFNFGDEVAENVYIQFYLQMPGEAEYSKLGEPILAGDVPARQGRAVYTYWDLEGENVEGAVIGAQAFVPGAVDVNPDDDFVSITVNVYYAFNGERAYSAVDDAYRFKNYNFNESKTEELAEELIATVAAGVPPSLEKDLWLRLFFPQTYVRLWDYFNESYRSGAGGHCYGMAATSALYFTDPSLRPVAKKTYQMSQEEASQNIDIYHRAQMIPLVRSLLADESPYFDRGYGSSSSESQSRTYASVKRSLKEDRKPLLISFRGQKNNSTWGHAVLAYKLVEVEGEDYKQVYIYDSNTLMQDLEDLKKPMPVALLWLDGFHYYSVQSGNQDYGSRLPSKIAANPVFRTIPLDEANALLPGMKEMAKSWVEVLKKNGKFAAAVRCPADALFTDSSGRRVGTIDGRVVNEIPRAEVMSSGEVEIYLLPADLEYSLEISGTGTGLVDFDVISPEGESSAKVVSFTNVSIGAGKKLTSEITAGADIGDLKSGTSTMEPSLSGVLDLGAEGEGDETAAGDEDGTEGGVQDGAAAFPAAEQELIFERTSIWAVDNGPTSPTSFTIDREWTATEIKTYHWNYGQGKAPGMIGLQDERGMVLGTWPASGLPGSGGVPDAYWTARPNLVLQPGKYTILDSDPATWSQNGETGGEGIAWVYGLPSKDSGDGSGIESEGLPFTDDFDDGDMAGWTVGGLLGSWTVSAEEGVLRQNSNDFGGSEGAEGTYLGTYVTAGGPSWRNYDFMARVRPVDNDGIGLIFRYEDSSNYYRFLWVGDESSTGPLRRLDRIKGGLQTVLKSESGEAARYDPGRWYNLEASLDGDVIRVYIDGALWGEVRDAEIESGGVGLFSYAQEGVEFDDVVVTEADGSSASAAGPVSKEAVGAGSSADSGWGLPEYGEILIDAPPGGWEGVVPGEAI